MSVAQQIFRYFVAAILGIAAWVLLPVPGLFGPTFAVVTFVFSCYVLGSLSVWVTLAFTLLVGSTPILAFAFGYWSHSPLLQSLLVSVEGFAQRPTLVVAFLVAPLAVGVLLHVALRHIRVRNVPL